MSKFLIKVLRIIGLMLIVLLISLTVIYVYFSSDFFKADEFKKKIEADFNLMLTASPKLIDSRKYGWAEEGGDVALLQINSFDCLSLSKMMLVSNDVSDDSYDGNDIFKKNHLTPKNIRIFSQSTNHGDFVRYKLDVDSCIIYRWSHFE